MDEAYTGSAIADVGAEPGDDGQPSARDEADALCSELLRDENEGLAVGSEHIDLLTFPDDSFIRNCQCWFFPVGDSPSWGQFCSSICIYWSGLFSGTSLVIPRDGCCLAIPYGVSPITAPATCFVIDTLITFCLLCCGITGCE